MSVVYAAAPDAAPDPRDIRALGGDPAEGREAALAALSPTIISIPE